MGQAGEGERSRHPAFSTSTVSSQDSCSFKSPLIPFCSKVYFLSLSPFVVLLTMATSASDTRSKSEPGSSLGCQFCSRH